ncbi:MAG: winged helix DNA-binding domain-containing protein [Theionarchaea archaeon]|nr:winged helix DNA-binding domain-containing protein [Theionarchaea archaeon]
MLEITPHQARYALFEAHSFTSLHHGLKGTVHVMQRHRCIQTDPIDVAGRNADLTLQSRVASYAQSHLYTLLYETRVLFEYYCKMMSILPLETFPFFHVTRAHFQEKYAPFFTEHKRETEFILAALEEGPICSREFKGWKKVQWWGATSLSRVILERLFICGKVMIHHREGALKYYSLTEDILSPSLLEKDHLPHARCREEMTRMIVRASRLVSPSGAPEQWYNIGKTDTVKKVLHILEKKGDIFPVSLTGHKKIYYAPIEDRSIWENPLPPDTDTVRFLAPLDPLIWSRSLFNTVYERKYIWEVYKKPQDRLYGYYCLPVLFNGEYVALIEPYLRKGDNILEIRGFHILQEPKNKNRFHAAFLDELNRFNTYVGAERIQDLSAHPFLAHID